MHLLKHNYNHNLNPNHVINPNKTLNDISYYPNNASDTIHCQSTNITLNASYTLISPQQNHELVIPTK